MKWLLSLAIVSGGIFLIPQPAPAIPRYTTLTKQQCLHCHVGMVNKTRLNEAGEYYRLHHTLGGYQPKGK